MVSKTTDQSLEKTQSVDVIDHKPTEVKKRMSPSYISKINQKPPGPGQRYTKIVDDSSDEDDKEVVLNIEDEIEPELDDDEINEEELENGSDNEEEELQTTQFGDNIEMKSTTGSNNHTKDLFELDNYPMNSTENNMIRGLKKPKSQSQPFNYAEPCRLTYAFGTVLTSNTDTVLTSLNANETTKPFNFAEPCKLTYGSAFGAVTDPSVYHKSNNVNRNGFGAVSDATGQSDYHKTGYAPSKTYTGPSLNTGTVSGIAPEVEPSQKIRSHELRQLERDNFVELNSKYEKSYLRKRFAVRLFGPMLGKFKQKFAERKLEIAQIKDVHEIFSGFGS